MNAVAQKPTRWIDKHILLLCFLPPIVAGCAPNTPPDGDNGNGDNTPPARAAVTQENLAVFSQEINAAVTSAVRSVVDQAPPSTARVLAGGGRTRVDTIDDLTIAGHTGMARVNGVRSLHPLPARYELSFAFENYATSDTLLLTGTLEYNCIVDTRSSPAMIHGLYRALLTLGGDYTGQIDVRASVLDGAVRALALTSGGTQLLLNAHQPEGFLTYVSTLAGTGAAGLQDGPGGQAMFNSPTGIAVNDDGRIYVADRGNSAIREIDLDGTVHTVTTQLQEPYDIGFDSFGLLVVSDQLGGSHGMDEWPLLRLVVRGDARGTIIPIVAGTGNHLNSPFPLCPITQYSCDGRSPIAAAPWSTGIDVKDLSVLVAEWALRPSLRLVLPDGFIMTMLDLGQEASTVCDEAHPGGPRDLAMGNNGEIYFTTDCHAVRVFDKDGQVRTLAGRLQTDLEFADGIGEAARFSYPEGIVFDGERYLYVADYNNALIRRVDTETGEAMRIAGCLAHTPGFDCTSPSGFRDGPGDYALFDGPNNIAIDPWGDLYIVEERNHAVRLLRIIADPQRTPTVHHFDPVVMEQGQSAKLTITGRNLTTVRALDLGAGVTLELDEIGYQRVTARLSVAADAATGPRRLTVTTAYGSFTTPEDLALTIMENHRGGTQVETIAGTGSAEPDRLNYGPARSTTFAFPGGIHAISEDRLLVADPVEQRIRLIATRVGAVEEFFELLVYAATGSDTDALGGIIGVFDSIEQSLDFFGIGSGIVGQTEDKLRQAAEKAVDEICNTIGANNCDWLSLPWAGQPYVPGEQNGFRLKSTFFLPSDIWAEGSGFSSKRFYIADSGNSTIRVVGFDVEQQQEAPMQVFSTDDQPDYPFAVTPLNTSVFTSLPALLSLSRMSLNSGAVREGWASIPRGVPLGIAAGPSDFSSQERVVFVADPLNSTIWRVKDKGGVAEVKNIRGFVPSFVIGKCADGPAAFATWGAPTDVAVDQSGNVYVADCGCNSIRVIKDRGYGTDFDRLVGDLRGFVASHQGRISAAAAQAIEENLRLSDTQFLDDNRYWVETLAGSPDGEPGFVDGPAELARFHSPTSLALTSTGEGKVIFVADTGNRRIRRIIIP